ncbi:MAG: hypothetical protein ACWGIK_16325 [Achromobacter pulmonis]|uniref:DUF1127 domain-containing protein n=1 Tax=Achromobacter pulmonis TaxID=1389932 RepID=A0A6S7EMC3_9BURK|nr:hypothetical protein [Achromobacter pulmonis]CAB3918331.1 hypothetical protein LMG26788_05194 [Achromobacter pulmonis]
MSPQTCFQASPSAAPASPPTGPSLASVVVGLSASAVSRDIGTPLKAMVPAPSAPGGILLRLWRRYRQRRAHAVLRNLAEEMDPHMLADIGAPQWLVNQSTANRALTRRVGVEYLRW